MLSELLKVKGIKSNCKYNGVEAVSEIKNPEYMYSMIIIDKNLPEMNGIEATKKIRQLNSNIPIIAFTGDTLSKQQFMNIGINDILFKPIDINDFNNILEKFYYK
jgi:osomolarity two-component system sensor histidine kinase TcsA